MVLTRIADRGRHRLPAFEVYTVCLGVSAAGLAVALSTAGASLNAPPAALVALVALAVIAERQPVRITANAEMTVSVVPVLFAAVAYGPLAAMLVGAAGVVAELRPPFVRWATWTSIRALTAGLAGSAAFMVGGVDDSFGRLVAAVVAASVTDAAVDVFLGALTVALRGSGSCVAFLRSLRPVLLGTVPLYTPAVVLLIYAYEVMPPWSVLMFGAPAFAAQKLYRLYREERSTAEQLKEANTQLERANLSFAAALVAALDARDQYTAGHSAAVAIYARDIAARLQLSEKEQEIAHLAGMLHDIGKVGVPAGILEKQGPLTLAERRAMEEHSVIGERILANVDDYREIALIVRHHHERIDGNGYPDGLTDGEIPLLSKILAVADAYSAMTSGRPYRDAMPSRVARLRLAQAVENQFDTTVVAAFEAVLATASEAYRDGARADFAVEAQRYAPLRFAAALA